MSAWLPERLPRALLVDLDGTLADSHPVLRRCLGEFAGAHGIAMDDADFAAFDGSSLREIVTDLRHRHGLKQSATELLATYHATLQRAYDAVPAAAGADRLVAAAKEIDAMIILVTSAPASVVDAFLARTGLRDALTELVTGDEGPTKPSPMPYRRALAAAGVSAAEAIAVEDSPSGVRSACGAGIRVIAVTGDAARAAALRVAGAVAIASDLAHVADLVRRVA